jgi:hypothetical protein
MYKVFLEYLDLHLTNGWGRFYVAHSVLADFSASTTDAILNVNVNVNGSCSVYRNDVSYSQQPRSLGTDKNGYMYREVKRTTAAWCKLNAIPTSSNTSSIILL